MGSFDFPWEMYIQAAQQKANNQMSMMNTFGQGLAGLGQNMGQAFQKRNEQEKWKNAINGLIQQNPQMAPYAGVFSQKPELMGQIAPGLMRKQKEYSVISGMLSKNGNPLRLDNVTGELTEVPVQGGVQFNTSQIKPPQGWRFTADGQLEVIPGGPPDLKNQEAEAAKQKQYDEQMGKAKTTVDTVNEALKMVGPGTSGALAMTRAIPGSPARNLQAKIDTIKANLGFDQLSAMKAQTRTGASGLGQLSDNEMKLLTSVVSSLDQAQSPKQLKEQLGKVKTHFSNFMQMMEGKNPYKKDVGMKPGAIQEGYRFKGGDPSDPKNWEALKK